jgi:hypothetical protein
LEVCTFSYDAATAVWVARMKEGARKKVHDQMKKVPGPKLSTKTSDERMNENTSV